jgi:hypothetical protein
MDEATVRAMIPDSAEMLRDILGKQVAILAVTLPHSRESVSPALRSSASFSAALPRNKLKQATPL